VPRAGGQYAYFRGGVPSAGRFCTAVAAVHHVIQSGATARWRLTCCGYLAKLPGSRRCDKPISIGTPVALVVLHGSGIKRGANRDQLDHDRQDRCDRCAGARAHSSIAGPLLTFEPLFPARRHGPGPYLGSVRRAGAGDVKAYAERRLGRTQLSSVEEMRIPSRTCRAESCSAWLS